MSVSPAGSQWEFPDLRTIAAPGDFTVVGGDLSPATLLAGYAQGYFPMPHHAPRRRRWLPQPRPQIAWWSPDPRGIVPVDGMRVTRSLRKSAKHFEVRVDTAFEQVMAGCADPNRGDGWISDEITRAYGELAAQGRAHSVEVWREGRLVGGLYGVAIGGFFSGESMFHTERDASKVALMGLVDLLSDEHVGTRLLDVQWVSDHLASLGAIAIPRSEYLTRLEAALDVPLPEVWR